MKADDFKAGATIRVGKGFECLEEGSVHLVEVDGNGTPHIRCQYKGQTHKGWHYPLDARSRTDDNRLKEMYLVASPSDEKTDA